MLRVTLKGRGEFIFIFLQHQDYKMKEFTNLRLHNKVKVHGVWWSLTAQGETLLSGDSGWHQAKQTEAQAGVV